MGLDKRRLELPENTFIFEMGSIYTRVVTPFDRTEVFLLAVRNKYTGEYWSDLDRENWCADHGIEEPKQYTALNHLKELKNLKKIHIETSVPPEMYDKDRIFRNVDKTIVRKTSWCVGLFSHLKGK